TLRSSSTDSTRPDVLVHVASLTTDECLIDLALAGELSARCFILHRQTNTLKHKPSGLLADSRSATNLITTHAILATSKHPHRKQPLIKRDRRILEDSPHLDRELRLRMATLALPHATHWNKRNIRTATRRTSDTIRPATRHKVIQAVVGISEVED